MTLSLMSVGRTVLLKVCTHFSQNLYDLPFCIADLDPNTKYYVSLAALSEYGTGPFSEEVQVQTLEDGTYNI